MCVDAALRAQAEQQEHEASELRHSLERLQGKHTWTQTDLEASSGSSIKDDWPISTRLTPACVAAPCVAEENAGLREAGGEAGAALSTRRRVEEEKDREIRRLNDEIQRCVDTTPVGCKCYGWKWRGLRVGSVCLLVCVQVAGHAPVALEARERGAREVRLKLKHRAAERAS